MTRPDTMSEEYAALEKQIHELELQIELNELLGDLADARFLAQLRNHLQRLKAAAE